MKLFTIFLSIGIIFCNDLIDINYKQSQEIEFVKKIKNYTKLNSYESENGTLVSIGDSLIIGKPYLNKNKYNEMDGTNENVFSNIIIGGIGLAAMAGIEYLTASSQDDIYTVEKIWVQHTGMGKKSPLIALVTLREPNIPKAFNKRTVLDLEKAIKYGEIVSPNAPMSRDEAIAKLKEAKELLDLEMMTQEEYDTLKDELSPIIRSNK